LMVNSFTVGTEGGRGGGVVRGVAVGCAAGFEWSPKIRMDAKTTPPASIAKIASAAAHLRTHVVQIRSLICSPVAERACRQSTCCTDDRAGFSTAGCDCASVQRQPATAGALRKDALSLIGGQLDSICQQRLRFSRRAHRGLSVRAGPPRMPRPGLSAQARTGGGGLCYPNRLGHISGRQRCTSRWSCPHTPG
jgi:hypothetical protein